MKNRLSHALAVVLGAAAIAGLGAAFDEAPELDSRFELIVPIGFGPTTVDFGTPEEAEAVNAIAQDHVSGMAAFVQLRAGEPVDFNKLFASPGGSGD